MGIKSPPYEQGTPAEIYMGPQVPQASVSVQVTHGNSLPPQQPVTPGGGCFARNQRNKPQSNSVGAASMIFMSGGMFMAWSFGFGFSLGFKMTTEHMTISWFLGAIIGALAGSIVTNILRKKLLYLFTSVLVIISGILVVSMPNDYEAIIAARYLNGIGNGIAVVVALVMAGEEGLPSLRGMLASTIETMSFSLGMYLQIIVGVSWSDISYNSFNATQFCAVLTILYGIIALLLSLFLVIESPIFLLERCEEQLALDSLRRLQRPFIITQETYVQLEEHKRYIEHNKTMSLEQSIVQGLPALLKLCIYRAMVALSCSLIVVGGFLTAATAAVQTLVWPFILYGTFRWLGTFITAFLLDSAGRKKTMLFGVLICGGMAIGVGSIFGDILNIFYTSKMSAVIGLLLVYQLFAGVYIASSSVYLSEAFPLAVKSYFIAIAFICEMLVHIIICVSTVQERTMSDYFYTVGALSLVFFVFGFICLPETKQTTLRQAQAKFKDLMSNGFN